MDKENGYFTFERAFNNCCAQCSRRLAYKKRQDSPVVAEAEREREELYAAMKEKLGPDKILINQYDAAVASSLGADTEYINRQGFRDCVYLLRWLDLLK